MYFDPLYLAHLTGMFAIVSVVCYAVGDVLMLAAKTNLADYPNLQPHAKLLSGTERMVALSEWRLVGGGLIGVLVTPLLIAGLWHLFYGLAPAGALAAWPPVILFGIGFILAPFVHGSFIYLGEYVQALNRVSQDSQAVIIDMFNRHKKIMILSYGPLLVCLLIASVWFSLAVAFGETLFPRWMAAVNPITTLIAWLIVRRVAPTLVQPMDGAGFNIALFAFFTLTTVTLW